MKVFIWTGGHTITESLYENPPENVEVFSNMDTFTKKTGVSGERVFVVPSEAKKILDHIAYGFGAPRILASAPKCDIIHTVSGLVPLLPRPWITSISMPSSFFGLNDNWFKSKRRLWLIGNILRSSNCKKITCFSESTLQGFREVIGVKMQELLDTKLEVLYPAIDPRRFKLKRKSDNGQFRVLFVGNHFIDKGGRELHRAVSRLSAKYDILLDLVTDVPPHHKDELNTYMRRHQEKWVRWHVPGLPRRKLIDELYPSADVFVMCSYMEVFGYVFLEAMASGLPIIGANVYAQREIISDGRNGYLIDVPVSPFEGEPPIRTNESAARYRRTVLNDSDFNGVVDQLVSRLTTLIEDGHLRREMSNESLRMTTEGKFSVGARNRKLLQIYREALE